MSSIGTTSQAMAAQRRGLGQTVEFLSNGQLKAAEVEEGALVLDSVATEYKNDGLTPAMRVSYSHALEAVPQEQREEYQAIRGEIGDKVVAALGVAPDAGLQYAGKGASMAGGVQSFDLMQGDDRVRVYLDDTPGVPGGLLFIDTAVDEHKPPKMYR